MSIRQYFDTILSGDSLCFLLKTIMSAYKSTLGIKKEGKAALGGMWVWGCSPGNILRHFARAVARQCKACMMKCHMRKRWVIRRKGPFKRESTTEQQMPFVSSQILQSDICYGLFHTQWPSSLLRKEKERDEEKYVSFPSPCTRSSVNAQDGLGDFFRSLFHGKVMPTNHPSHPTPISQNITKDHPQFPALNTYGED